MAEYYLGIDTSNYKTSVAIVNSTGEIICNVQEYLEVKKGERGLRQSTALFQHVNKLPLILEKIFKENKDISRNIKAISVSTRPRNIEGSYMPVFKAGEGYARTLSSALNIPLYTFSHQEGHIEAVKFYSPLREKTNEFVTFHFSGGTTEALLVNDDEIKIIGGTLDIAFGQLIDRVGVALDLAFPCGMEMDKLAIKTLEKNSKIEDLKLPKIAIKDGFVNLSGIETCVLRLCKEKPKEAIIKSLFDSIALAISNITLEIHNKYNIKDFIFAGGVSSSMYIRNAMECEALKSINKIWSSPALSSDNAVGIALLGRRRHGN